jgi:hypothetical protein
VLVLVAFDDATVRQDDLCQEQVVAGQGADKYELLIKALCGSDIRTGERCMPDSAGRGGGLDLVALLEALESIPRAVRPGRAGWGPARRACGRRARQQGTRVCPLLLKGLGGKIEACDMRSCGDTPTTMATG